MEFLGYSGMLLMGLILGLLGGGGSLIAVPILVYAFNVSAELATSYSLALVAVSSLFGLWRYQKEGALRVKEAVLFSLPAMLGVWVARVRLLPMIPAQFTWSGLVISKESLILWVFALTVCVISVYMFKSKSPNGEGKEAQEAASVVWVILDGLIVGGLTGFIGAGGGFVIVPAMVALLGLSLREAIASSLLVIILKSSVGILGDWVVGVSFDLMFLLSIILLAAVGVALGSALNHRFNPNRLRQVFVIVVAMMGVSVIMGQL